MLLKSIETADIKFFLDAANLWGVDYDESLGQSSYIRSSIGIGANVWTPVGPLSWTFAQDLTNKMMMYPLAIAGVCTIASIIGTYFVRLGNSENIMMAL